MNFQISDETAKRLIEFRDARDWQKYHTPGELARAVSIEAAELSELHLWGRYPAITKAEKEVADVAIFLFYYCHVAGIDLDAAVNFAIDQNEKNYPLSNGDRPDRDK